MMLLDANLHIVIIIIDHYWVVNFLCNIGNSLLNSQSALTPRRGRFDGAKDEAGGSRPDRHR